MSADSRLKLRTAAATALEAASGVTDLVPAARIVDRSDRSIAKPYIRVGPIGGRNFDTKTTDGMEGTLEVHCWSHYAGTGEDGHAGVEAIQAAIEAALDTTSLSVSGETLVVMHLNFVDEFQDDADTFHGVQRFRFITSRE